METVEPGSDYDTSEAESNSEAPPPCNMAQPPGGLDENQDTSNVPRIPPTGAPVKGGCGTPPMAAPAEGLHPGTAGRPDTGVSTSQLLNMQSGGDTCKGLTSMTARKRRKRSGAPIKEGTYIGGGRRMMCYCPKHSHLAESSAITTHYQQGIPPRVPVTAPGVTSASVHSASNRTPALMRQQLPQQQHCPQGLASQEGMDAVCDGQPAGYELPQHKAGCIRGVPFNHASRRGQREPDAIAAALAKRLFVAKTPYMIAGPQRHARHQLPLAHRHATEAPFLTDRASSGPTPVGPGRSQSTKTQTQRFREMQQTVGRRLTCGKSAIHGLGAFTKQPHAPGD